MPPSAKCTICNQDAGLKCTGCLDAKYCSPECQRTDWVTHKLLCKTFKDFQSQPEGKMTMRRAILLPVDGTKPKFTWVDIYKCPETGYESPINLHEIIGGRFSRMAMEFNAVRNVYGGVQIELFCLGSFLQNSPSRNMTIHRLVGDCKHWFPPQYEKPEHPWRGNVLCMPAHKEVWIGPDDTDDDPHGPIDVYRNINTSGFRTIVDYLSIKRANGICEMEQVSAIWAAKLKGVRVQGTCPADLKFTAVAYPKDHPFTRNDRTDSGDKFVGLRLETYKMPLGKANHPPSAPAMATRKSGEISFIAKALFPNPPTVEDLHQIDTHFVREAGKDLLPEHMEVFVKLLIEQYAMIMEALHGGSPRISRDNILGRRALEAKWKKFKEENGWANDLPSPYEV